MVQPKLESLFESILNVFVGFIISVIATLIVLPLFGFAVTGGQSIVISAVFTVLSIARSYFLRRLFERWRLRKINGQTI
tara:strand:+ start:96 stop:332 length:237 start_codon:yes stop_codon:yes gene_type:complete